MGAKKNYPAQTGKYKVATNRKTARWKDYSNTRLQISMDNENQTGEKLKSLVDWATAGRFEKVEIILSDTLNWFNLAFRYGLKKEDAMRKALLAGDNWLETNSFLKDYPVIIRRWDEWFKDIEHDRRLIIIRSIYEGNQEFQTLVEDISERIWNAKVNVEHYASNNNYPEFLDYSKEYILSELSIFSIMFNEQDAIDIYPGTWLKSIFSVLCLYSENHPFLKVFNNKAYLQVEFVRNKSAVV